MRKKIFTNHLVRDSERNQWVKVLAIKPGNLSSIPRTHVKVEDKNQLHKTVL